jgi:hypothetical protein
MEVAKVPKAGGAKVTLFSGGVDGGFDLANGLLYFQSYDAGGIVSLPVAGGTPTFLTPAGDVRGLAASPSSIFLGDNSNALPMSDAVIAQAPVGGGNRVPLVTIATFIYAVTFDATSVYWCADSGVSKLAF